MRASSIANRFAHLLRRFWPRRSSDYFEHDHPSPYMLHVYKIRPDKRVSLCAVNHIDDTGRLQTVTRSENPLYYDLIQTFGRKTGIPVILNTSFNESEPIVCTPEEAIDCFRRTKMDAISMGLISGPQNRELMAAGAHETGLPAAGVASCGIAGGAVGAWRGIRALFWQGDVLYGCRGYELVALRVSAIRQGEKSGWEPVAQFRPAWWRRLTVKNPSDLSSGARRVSCVGGAGRRYDGRGGARGNRYAGCWK